MKILIFEAYTDANVGSAALIENSIKIVKKLMPQSEIAILAHDAKAVQDFAQLSTRFEIFKMPYKKSRFKQLFWLISNFMWMLTNCIIKSLHLPITERMYTFDKDRLASLEAIKKSDICISIGAERINDNFYLGIPFSLYMLWLVKAYGKKLITFPQTIGPFYFGLSKFFARRVLNLCDFIFVRDLKSADVLGSLKIPRTRFKFVPDIALLQEASKTSQVQVILRKEGIPEGQQLCGISALRWSYFKAAREASTYHDYIQILARAADYLIDKYNYHIVFVPTNLRMHGCRDDDVGTSEEIIALMKNKERASLIRNLYRPSEIKGLFGAMDMAIVTRMHACILAAGIFTPMIAINYQFKLYEFMKLLGLENNSVDIDKLTFARIKELIDYTYDSRTLIRERLETKVSQLQQMINDNLAL